MSLSPELIALGSYLTGEFDNKEQALDRPAWFVHLRLWKRPVSIFTTDSITLFAEQASVVNIDRPYRPRILRLQQHPTAPHSLQVKYYMFENVLEFRGGGRRPELLQKLTPEKIKLLPDCTLNVKVEGVNSNEYSFSTTPVTEKPCSFSYEGNTYQVFLGFEVTSQDLKTYDRGIDPKTGKAIWGALMGPYCFRKLD